MLLTAIRPPNCLRRDCRCITRAPLSADVTQLDTAKFRELCHGSCGIVITNCVRKKLLTAEYAELPQRSQRKGLDGRRSNPTLWVLFAISSVKISNRICLFVSLLPPVVIPNSHAAGGRERDL